MMTQSPSLERRGIMPAKAHSTPHTIYSSAISRVLNIDELLGIVFSLCLKEDCLKEGGEGVDDSREWALRFDGNSCYPCPSVKEAPLQLAHVCHHWRSVAFDTPKLWSRLHLELSRQLCRDVPRMESRLSALRFWLAHSRSNPISVRLHVDQWAYDVQVGNVVAESKVLLTRMVGTLFDHAHRWENIEMLLPEFAALSFYNNIDQEYPYITSFKLGTRSLSIQRNFFGRNRFLLSAPNVKELALPGRGIRRDVFAPTAFPPSIQLLKLSHLTMYITQSMHGSHLRKLALNNVFLPQDVFAMFSIAFPLLAKLILVYDRDIGKDVDAEEHQVDFPNWDFVVLDHLTSIRLFVFEKHQLHVPLSLITAPVLKHLAVIKQKLSAKLDVEIIEFLRRSQAPVEYFCYERPQETVYDDAGLLQDDERNDDADLPVIVYDPDVSDVSFFAPENHHILSMVREMPYLKELEVHEPALSSVISFLRDPTHLPRLRKIYNEGGLCVMTLSDGYPQALSGPCVKDVLRTIHDRCRRRHALNDANHIWLERLALPMHEEHEEMIRGDAIFRRAVLDFESTHECDQGSISEDFDIYL